MRFLISEGVIQTLVNGGYRDYTKQYLTSGLGCCQAMACFVYLPYPKQGQKGGRKGVEMGHSQRRA